MSSLLSLLKSPAATEDGNFPTGKSVFELKPPAPFPNSTETEPPSCASMTFATARSGLLSPLKSPDVMAVDLTLVAWTAGSAKLGVAQPTATALATCAGAVAAQAKSVSARHAATSFSLFRRVLSVEEGI